MSSEAAQNNNECKPDDATAKCSVADDVVGADAEIYEDPEPYPPWNFSWVVENELACMAWPQNTLNLDYLYDVGIRHLVTLSQEKMPPMEGYSKLQWTLISVEEFEDPSIEQIVQFIDICSKALQKKQPVGVHCRMGRGRSGVMAGCYLVKFKDLTPERAITDVRLSRPHSIETPEQERVIFKYFDHVRGTIIKPAPKPQQNGTATANASQQ